MNGVEIKKIIKIGGSVAIILPKACAMGKLKPGEEMVLVGNPDSGIHIYPVRVLCPPVEKEGV